MDNIEHFSDKAYRIIIYIYTYIQTSNFSIFCYGKENASNYMKIHFTSAMFLPMLAGFYIKRLSFYLGNLNKNLTRSKLVKLLLLLCISPRIKILCVQLLLYKYCHMQCNVLFSHVKNCFKNSFGCFI